MGGGAASRGASYGMHTDAESAGPLDAAPQSSVGVKVARSVPVVPHRTIHMGGCIVDLSRPHTCSLAGLHAIKRLVRVRATVLGLGQG